MHWILDSGLDPAAVYGCLLKSLGNDADHELQLLKEVEQQSRLMRSEWERTVLGTGRPHDAYESIRCASDVRQRRAAYEAIGQYVTRCSSHLPEMIRVRNRLARKLGFEHFHAFASMLNDGVGSEWTRGRLQTIARDTVEPYAQAMRQFRSTHGRQATAGWNIEFYRSGSGVMPAPVTTPQALTKALRLLANAPWAARPTKLRLDLFRRDGKQSLAFTELLGVGDAWNEIGCALSLDGAACTSSDVRTLLHEIGHCAHYASADARQPMTFMWTSGIVAETVAVAFETIPSVVDCGASEDLGAADPFPARSNLSAALVEMKLYELPDADVSATTITAVANALDREITGLETPAFPVLIVPHLYSTETSGYFYTYAIAEDNVQRMTERLRAQCLLQSTSADGLGERVSLQTVFQAIARAALMGSALAPAGAARPIEVTLEGSTTGDTAALPVTALNLEPGLSSEAIQLRLRGAVAVGSGQVFGRGAT